MDITPFIRELLFGHDCVIVPGFGGFIGNYTPARVDKTTSTFYPPVKQISFNRNLNHNDGLLVGRISSSLNISYGDARTLVEEFVADTRKKLERGAKILFDNIGSFINNQEGNLQFEPDRSVNYHLDSYGLESFMFPPLERYDVRKRITSHIGSVPLKHSATRKIIMRAAVIVPILALIVAVPLKTSFFKSKIEASTLNPLAREEFEDNNKAVENDVPAPVINIGETAEPEPPAEALSTEPEPAYSYYIITGSFREKENALIHASMLEEKGYSPEVLEAPNGFYRVSAMRCIDMDAAEEDRDSVSLNFPGSWIKKI